MNLLTRLCNTLARHRATRAEERALLAELLEGDIE